MMLRRFPRPWRAEETDACFIVKDRNGQALACVNFENEPRGNTRPAQSGEMRCAALLRISRRCPICCPALRHLKCVAGTPQFLFFFGVNDLTHTGRFSRVEKAGHGEVHTAIHRIVLCPSIRTCSIPTRNPASRLGYKGPGGPISAGATRSN